MIRKSQSSKGEIHPVELYNGEPGPHHVQAVIFNWVDAERNREVPAKAYYPGSADGKFPLVIFSHGLGGTRQGYEYVGRHWASQGYVCVHVQHRGSDNETAKNTGKPSEEMRKAATAFENLFNRPNDVSFAINQMERLNEDPGSELHDRIDLQRVGVAGHSFGAYTAHASSGRAIRGLEGILDLSDRRVKACIAISAPANDSEEFRQSFRKFQKPCLHITGVYDTSPIGETKVEHRRLPFDSIKSKDQYLVIFRDADHMVFTGKVWPGRDAGVDGEIHRLVKAGTTLFLDAYLKGDKRALALISGDGLDRLCGSSAVVARK